MDSMSEESDETAEQNDEWTLFRSLMSECRHAAPEARLSASLRSDLEQLSPEARRSLVSRKRRGCAPLLLAVRRGSLPIAEYLMRVCDAPLEQRGKCGRHRVTPLWVAAVNGQMDMLRALADAGAELDAPSDTGSTPARSACFVGRVNAVVFLAERGADLSRSNHSGSTCLINSVREPGLVQYLLSRGVNPNACDVHGRTALHHACRGGYVDSVRQLLDGGADPLLRCHLGTDAIMYAAVAGDEGIFRVLRERRPGESLVDALAVLASTSLLQRDAGDEMRTLLVVARALGERHPETGNRIARVAAERAAGGRWREAAQLYEWALRVRIAAGTLLQEQAAATLVTVSHLFLYWYLEEEAREGGQRNAPTFAEIFNIFSVAADHYPEAQAAATLRPTCRRQADSLDATLRCFTHLLFVMLHVLDMEAAPPDDQRRPLLARRLRALLGVRPRSVRTGDTLLHYAVSRLNSLPVAPVQPARPLRSPFPCALTARALMAAGASPCVRNDAGGTALLTAATPHNHSAPVLRALLLGGGHLDQPNAHGDTAIAFIAARQPHSNLLPPRLLCLSAAVAAALPQPLPSYLPVCLGEFVELHRR